MRCYLCLVGGLNLGNEIKTTYVITINIHIAFHYTNCSKPYDSHDLIFNHRISQSYCEFSKIDKEIHNLGSSLMVILCH